MALMLKVKEEKDYVQVPNTTAQSPEIKSDNPISLQALGLIVNLWSYNVESWEVHKTEIYKRYKHNKRTSVSGAWAELVETKYILEFKVRIGREVDYVYAYRIRPFSEEEIKNIEAQVLDKYGDFSAVDFQHLKISSTKSAVQNQHILKTKEKKDLIKEKNIKEKETRLPSLESINSAKLFLKSIHPNAPIDEISAKLIEDAETDENLIVKHPNQFKGVLSSRLSDWERSKRSETAQFKSKKPVRTEVLPEWFETSYEAAERVENEDLDEKKKRIEAKLKYFRGEKTLDETKVEVAELLKKIDED